MRVSFWESLTPGSIFNLGLLTLVFIGTIVSFVISLKKKEPYASRFWMIVYSVYAAIHMLVEKKQFNSPYYFENYGNAISTFYTVIVIIDVICLMIAVLGTFFFRKQTWISVCIMASCFIILLQTGLILAIFSFIAEIVFCVQRKGSNRPGPANAQSVEPSPAEGNGIGRETNREPDVFCGYCGHKNPGEAAFCGKCGKPIVKLTERNS